MAFWTSAKVKEESSRANLVDPFNPDALKCGAYELSLGPEAFLTSYEDIGKKSIAEGEQLVIPPGQFGLLLTEEKVSVPLNALGFISIKAGIKFRGLVNVSGFHVDPGFQGRLKFSVYNAGSRDIVLERKRPVFLLWFSDLDRPSEKYAGEHANQNEITPDDVMRIQGQIASPGQLKRDLKELQIKMEKDMQKLEHKVDKVSMVLAALLAVVVSLAGYSLRGCLPLAKESDRTKQPVVLGPTNATKDRSTTSPK